MRNQNDKTATFGQWLRRGAAALLLTFGSHGHALDILLTNDDGWNSHGITALRDALIAAGHHVILAGPLVNQSGMGGSLLTQVGASVAVVESGGAGSNVWSVASTPTDAVRAAFGGLIDKNNPPDLVVSGINEGQNLGMTGSWASGTVNAALAGVSYGVPAIAISAERLLTSSATDTINAMPAIAAFTVRLIDRLQQTAMNGKLLPSHTLLNVNYPVFNPVVKPGPVQKARGVKVTNLAREANLRFVWVGNPAATGTMNVSIDFAHYLSTKPDPVPNSDTDAMKAGYVSVTPMDGDMTDKPSLGAFFATTQWRLRGLAP